MPHTYTDVPDLHPQPHLASLQLLMWLALRPTAWRNYVATIEPDLPCDFCLAELTRYHWHSRPLRRLLLLGFVVLPLCVSVTIVLIRSAVGQPIPLSIAGGAEGLAFCVGIGLATAISVNVATGISVGVMTGLTTGLVTHPTVEGLLLGLAVGAAFGMVQTGSRQTVRYSLTRQMGGVILGLVSSGAAFGFAALIASSLALGLTFGLVESFALYIIIGVRTRNWRRARIYGISFGLLTGAAFGLLNAPTPEVALALASGAIFSILCALPYAVVKRIVDPWAGAVAGALGAGGWLAIFVILSDDVSIWPTLPAGIMGILMGLSVTWWRPILLHPLLSAWNLLLYRLDERRLPQGQPSLLHWHSAFWDEHQRWRWFGLEDHVLLVLDYDPAFGQAALDYLPRTHQRWAVRGIHLELDARRMECADDVSTLSTVHLALAASTLAESNALLRTFSRISQDTAAALRQESAYNQRLALSPIEDRLDALLRELDRADAPDAVRFRPVAVQWRQIVAAYRHTLAQTVEQRQEIDNPYVIGVPLTAHQEIFVGRTNVSARIEQLLLDRRRPPLLLYGQRRMGKTSLLNNLGRLLPSTIVPLFVDLQGPASQAQNYTGFLYNIARGMISSAKRQRNLTLPPLSYAALTTAPFTGFDEWLDTVETALGDHTALLSLDEFEVLEAAIIQGKFDAESVLGMLRHLIQHRPRFKVLLAGSHTLDSFERWASYLINVQVVHIDYLKDEEARQLITRPIHDFPLRYSSAAIARTIALTRGHPALVQLLCSEIITLKNEQPPAQRRLAQVADVEAAVPEALIHGSFFFADIARNQVNVAELSALRKIAAHGEGAIVHGDAAVLASLVQRELLERVGAGYRFQVALIQRWFGEREEHLS